MLIMIVRNLFAYGICGLLAAIAHPVSPLHADELHIAEERIANCLQFSGDRYQCIGKAANVCSDLPTGSRQSGMRDCMALERAFWQRFTQRLLDGMLSKAAIYDEQNAADPNHSSLADGITAMQAGWIKFRDPLCRAKGTDADSGEFATNHCLMKQDGEQALYLLWLSEQHF